MVRVRIQEDRHGQVWSIRCQGHAGFDEDGQDIVCAAVSALTGALGTGFTQVLSLPVEVEARDGEFSLQLPADSQGHPEFASAQVLLRTIVAAIREMARYYPGFIVLEAGNDGNS